MKFIMRFFGLFFETMLIIIVWAIVLIPVAEITGYILACIANGNIIKLNLSNFSIDIITFYSLQITIVYIVNLVIYFNHERENLL